MDLVRGRKLLEAAFIWQDEGVSVVPVIYGSKEINIPWKIFQDQLPTDEQIRYWFSAGLVNIAVICGTGSLAVLDFDDQESYWMWKEKAGSLADTYTETTRRGFHVFFRVDQRINKNFIGCEFKADRKACNVAPSVLAYGNMILPCYQVYGDVLTPIREVTTESLFSLLSEKEPAADPNLQPAPRSIGKSKTNDLINRIKQKYPLLDFVFDLVRSSYPGDLEALPKMTGGNGRWFTCKCPLHRDHKPSFSVDARNQIWRCFSPACPGSKGGDVINLYALANGLNVAEAIRRLAKVTE